MELEHPNIVLLEDTVMLDNDIYFIQEYCNTDVAKYLHLIGENRMPQQNIKSYIK